MRLQNVDGISRNRQRRGGLADQHCDGVLILRSLNLRIGALHARLVQLGRSLCHIGRERKTPFEAILGELQCVLVRLDCVVQ